MRRLLVLAAALFPALASATTTDGHADPVAPLALALVIVLTVAKLGGALAVRRGQPAVLGELLAGVVLGKPSPAP